MENPMSPQQAVDGSQDAAPKSERASPSAVDAGALSNTETQNKPSETSYTTLPNREIDIESPERAPANSIRDELSAPPMTTSNSSSSHMSHKEGQANGAAGYGTRSRNRPASQRPNYAEDAEMEFEYQHPPAGAPGKEVPAEHTQTSSPSTSARQSPGPLVKRGAAPANGASTSQSKEPNIPGTSTFSANPNAAAPAPTSKKRKAAASANVLNGQSATNGASVASTRKAPSNAHFQPTRESNMYFFDKSKYRLKNGKLESDDGTAFAVDDFVYLVCEPPGEPYYLGRIMEFRPADTEDPNSPIDQMRINWFYRPRDVLRTSQDTRLLYATMHSDMCPLTSLRGKIQIRHRSEIPDLDEYRKQKDSFWFEEVFDRFIHRYYRAIPTSDVVNVPEKVKKALDDRWKYIVVEQNKIKELTTPGKSCVRCKNFAPPDESVECAICKNMYHMQCVRPPLAKKPSRGFGWSCAPCSRAQERRLEARHTPLVGDNTEAEDEELLEEEDEGDTGAAVNTTAPSPSGSDGQVDLHPGTQAEIALAKMWPMRYLGIHCRPEDALQYDDRAIYPRASSRLGPRHQANVNVWHGRPVELVKPAEIKKRYAKNATHKKDGKFSKDTAAALEAERAERAKRPKWVQDEPPGYVRRGDDHPNTSKENTAKLLFKMPIFGEHSSRGEDDAPAQPPDEELVDRYMDRAKAWARTVDIKECSVDFLDAAVRLLQDNSYDEDAALRQVKKLDPKKDLRDPMKILNGEEKKRFDEGAAKYGSELRSIRLHVKSVQHRDIVRYWYMWKVTEKGRDIWGHYGGRRGASKRVDPDNTTKLLDDIADDRDDSAFDVDKAATKKRGFCCKFCSSKKSRQWRRAPGVAPGATVSPDGKPVSKDKANALVVALCDRCASFWRRYAIKWEDWEDVAKKVAQGGTKQMRRRIDEEVLQEFKNAQEAATMSANDSADTGYATPGGTQEPSKKKQKLLDKDAAAAVQAKEKQKAPPPPKEPTPPPPPIVPAEPRFRDLPCAVCEQYTDPADPQIISCQSCRLTVHRNCYGIADAQRMKWICDTCTNDRIERVSYNYKCVLCPIESRWWQLVEPPKISHKKKGDREKEKERLEKELADNMERDYKQAQIAKGRPPEPREALKRTYGNNWVHITCAVWTPETKFGNAKSLDQVECIPQIPPARWGQTCKLCKRSSGGACVTCHQCHATFHIGCAHDAAYTFGFDITPVKGSRRDGANIVTFGNETGVATAAIWCKEHNPKTIVHLSNEVVDDQGTFALQRYVLNFKQADLTLTGTTRKANLLDESAKNIVTNGAVQAPNRRASTTTGAATSSRAGRNSNAGTSGAIEREVEHGPPSSAPSDRKCDKCEVDVSPRWFPVKERDKAHAAEAVRHPPTTDGLPTVNGIKHEPPNFNALHQPDTRMVNGVDDASHQERFLCQKCHWRRKNGQEEPPKPDSHEPDHSSGARSPTRPPLFPPLPEVSNALPRALHQWFPHVPPPATVAREPQLPGPVVGMYHNSTLPPQHQPSHAGPGFLMANPAGVPPANRSPFQPRHSTHGPPAPLNLQQSALVSGMPNGLPSPNLHMHGHGPPMGSPTHPLTGSAHQNGSPFSGPSQHLPSLVGSHGSHGSPPPASLGGRPSTPRDTPQQAVVPPGSDGRPVGGASASPSLRNLLH